MLLHEIPELRNYPNVLALVEEHLSMQFADVRSMLRLPLPEQGIDDPEYGGCNFAVAAVLCNLISGISVTIFMPTNPTQRNRKGEKMWIGPGKAFKQLIKNRYLWEPGDNPTDGANALYYLFRNPLTHALAVHGKSSYQIRVKKNSLHNEQIKQIEESPIRPNWLSPGLSGSGKQWTLDSRGFYRDVFHMFWNLAKDNKQMTEAEKRFLTGRIIWREGNP